MARATQRLAAWHSSEMLRWSWGSGIWLVDAPKMRSPSIGRWEGTIARENPSCAVVAKRFACALLKTASVATMPMLVFTRSESGPSFVLVSDLA